MIIKLSIPFIGAVIGWMTNYIAVKMLFHPRKKIKFFFINIHGIFPKRQKVIAEKLGSIISEELISINEIKQKLINQAQSEQMVNLLENHIDRFLKAKVKTSIPMGKILLNKKVLPIIKQILLRESREIMDLLIDKFGNQLEDAIDIRSIVKEKVESFSSEKLEEILYSIMKQEFHFIEIVGGVLGFLIGLVQLIIVELT